MHRRKIDIDYVEKLKNGDDGALAYIYEFYKNSLYYFALTYTKNAAHAEDVVQETFIQVIKEVSRLRKNDSFHSWMYKIAYHQSMLVHKKNKRQMEVHNRHEEVVEQKLHMNEKPNKIFEKKEFGDLVASEVEKMDDKFRQVAWLRFVKGLHTVEIAEQLEIPEGTVKTRLNKIRKDLRPALECKGFRPCSLKFH